MIAQVAGRISFRSFSEEGRQNLPPPCEINMDNSHRGVQAYLAYWMQGVLEKCMALPSQMHFRHGRCRKQLVSTTCLFFVHFLESKFLQSWTVMDPLLDSLLEVKNHYWRLVKVSFARVG